MIDTCRALSASEGGPGHDALCGTTRSLDAFCVEHRTGAPRMVAAMLAQSFAPGANFSTYWEQVGDLASLP